VTSTATTVVDVSPAELEAGEESRGRSARAQGGDDVCGLGHSAAANLPRELEGHLDVADRTDPRGAAGGEQVRTPVARDQIRERRDGARFGVREVQRRP